MQIPTYNNSLESALQYTQHGFLVFPVHSVIDGKCTCGKPNCNGVGKHPKNVNGFKGATSNKEQIIKWFSTPNTNIGIRTGRGRFVLDVDGEEGEESLYGLEDKFEKLPPTLKCKSGSGAGIHIYLASPEGIWIKTSAGKLGPHLDIRGEGGYIIAPPSLHISRNFYEWIDNEDIVETPVKNRDG